MYDQTVLQNAMPEQLHSYMVFFSNEWAIPPAFYWIDEVRGTSMDDAYKRNLDHIIQAAREFDADIFGDMSVENIEEGLCIVRRDNWMSLYNHEWRKLLGV